jgi:dTDP-4-dehydrorhamnose 3,5-epimerase
VSTLPTVAPLPTLPDVWLVTPRVHRDERGFFTERWTAAGFAELGLPPFVQDNHSRSERGTLRGLHFQAPPRAQGKLVSAIRGRVFDVAVDLRTTSPTYGRWDGVVLEADEPAWLWVPPGFAHGFLVVSDVADVLYKVTDAYAPETEGGVAWDDPDVGIDWPLAVGQNPILSAKDAGLPMLSDVRSPF